MKVLVEFNKLICEYLLYVLYLECAQIHAPTEVTSAAGLDNPVYSNKQKTYAQQTCSTCELIIHSTRNLKGH
jgi:hypothetical protein